LTLAKNKYMPSTDERAFFDRIRNEPGEDGPRLIYADWLDENGQSDRAEFIRLQCALARLPDEEPGRPELRERERILRDANEVRWAADLAPLVSGWEFRRGVIDSVSVGTSQFLTGGAAVFDLAPVRKVRVLDVGDRLQRLVQSPLLAHIRELDFCGNDLGNRGPVLLGRSRHLTRLDALDLAVTALGDHGLQALADSPVFASLRTLHINGNDNARPGVRGMRALADSPHLAELVRLDVSGNNLSEAALRTLFEGRTTGKLARLVLHGNRLGDDGTAALVNSVAFARMVERDGAIDLRRVEMGPGGARALAEARAVQSVESLDLEGNFLGDAGLSALADSPHLTHLRVLSLRENRIGDKGVRALARSPLMATLRVLDLTDNLITEDSQDRLREASIDFDWRGLQLKVNSKHKRRAKNIDSPHGHYRRPLP
jgi:uncharacterized protein (TIGR02996 family)